MSTLSGITLTEAFDVMSDELTEHLDRLLGVERLIRLERESEKHWIAVLSDRVLYRSPDRLATVRFMRTFAVQTAGVVVDEDSVSYHAMTSAQRAILAAGYSLLVPPAVDNVVPIRAEA